MWRKTSCVLAVGLVIGSLRLTAQDATAVLDQAAKAIGGELTSIQYAGSGAAFTVGQSPRADAPWPGAALKTYTALVNYTTPAMRQEIVRVQLQNPPPGVMAQPITGEQRQVQVVSGRKAWNVAGENATPSLGAVVDRLTLLWSTPHGFLRAAKASGASAKSETVAGRTLTRVSFTAHGKIKMTGLINEQHQIEKIETWVDNAVLGDMLVETAFSDYKPFGAVTYPGRIVQKQGGHTTLDLTIASVEANPAADIPVPANVEQATLPAVKAEAQKLADGVFYVTGGSHHSVAVEFKDHLVVIEGPQNEERSLAVIAELKKADSDQADQVPGEHALSLRSLGRDPHLRCGGRDDRHAPVEPEVLRQGVRGAADDQPRQAGDREEGRDVRKRWREESAHRQRPHHRAARDSGQPAQRGLPDGVPAEGEAAGRSGCVVAARPERAATNDGEPCRPQPVREHPAAEARRRVDRPAARPRHDDGRVRRRGRQAGVVDPAAHVPMKPSTGVRAATSLDLLRRWAVILDSMFRVPGTRIRFGLDAILGLIPGVGDLSAPVFAALIIVTGFRLRVPAVVQARIVFNAALDMAIGFVPLLGDLFDIAWKANLRNLALLERHAQPGVAPRRGDYVFVIGCLVALGLLVALPLFVLVWLIGRFGAV